MRRMLDTNIWESGQIAKVSREARLLYIGTITIADDDGRLKGNLTLLRSKIFPFDGDVNTFKMETWLGELLKEKLLLSYEVNGEDFLVHPNWTKYQILRADRKKDSKIPEPPKELSDKCQTDDGQVTAEVKVSKDKISKDRINEMFDEFWSLYPRKVAKPKAKQSFEKILSKYIAERENVFKDIIDGLNKYKTCSQWTKDDGQFIPHPTTWLNQERWNDEVGSKTFSTGGNSDKFKGIGKKV